MIDEIAYLKETTYSVIACPSAKIPKAYEGYIFSKWLKSLRYGNPWFKDIKADEYYDSYHTFIEKLLEKPDSVIKLAVLSDDHDVCLGFSVSREDVLDYVYVDKTYRKLGIATALVPKLSTTFTHVTIIGTNIWQQSKNFKHLKFNPHA